MINYQGGPVAWQYKDSWKTHWSTCNERPASNKHRRIRALYPEKEFLALKELNDELVSVLEELTNVSASYFDGVTLRCVRAALAKAKGE